MARRRPRGLSEPARRDRAIEDRLEAEGQDRVEEASDEHVREAGSEEAEGRCAEGPDVARGVPATPSAVWPGLQTRL
jgi:hypothetical protein